MSELQYIIFDADDTLWENNILYEQVRDAIYDLTESIDIPRDYMEKEFIRIETRIVNEKGYGTPAFLCILDELRNTLIPKTAWPHFEQIVEEFQYKAEQPRRIFPGVPDTLQYLFSHYSLYLLTKGNHTEQSTKLEKSGLKKFFSGVFIESEKNIDTYRKILQNFGWSHREVCMIGNSPKSDINPAIRLGIKAIYIPYPHTWYHENEPLLTGNSLLQTIETFSELKKIF